MKTKCFDYLIFKTDTIFNLDRNVLLLSQEVLEVLFYHYKVGLSLSIAE